MRKLKAAELVLDFDLYPRTNVDTKNITDLAAALAAGQTLPPVIIDKKSRRVVDGFHRVRAHLKHFGDGADIEVIEKNYKSDKEMFLEAARCNAAHGAKLDTCDRVHCKIVADNLGLTLDAIAGALHMPAGKLGDLCLGRTATAHGQPLALKRTVRHKAGQELTKPQTECNAKLSGMNQSFYVNQLIMLIESDLLDTNDEALMERLSVLSRLLESLAVASCN